MTALAAMTDRDLRDLLVDVEDDLLRPDAPALLQRKRDEIRGELIRREFALYSRTTVDTP